MMIKSDVLKGKICLVTGGSRGIGKVICGEIIKQGGTSVSLSRSKGLRVDEIDDSNLEDNLIDIKCDITNDHDLKVVFKYIRGRFGRIDCLVNNAGIEFNERIGMLDKSNTQKMIDVNLLAPLYIIELASKLMIRQRSGSIVNITSVVGEVGNAGQVVYSATKGGLIASTKSAAKELSTFNVRVNAVSPGLTVTDMLPEGDQKFIEERKKGIKLGRLGHPEDVARLVLFLLSDESSYISGQVIRVDGLSVF